MNCLRASALLLITFAASAVNAPADEAYDHYSKQYDLLVVQVKKVASAVAAFKRNNHGAYPKSLEALAPRYLKTDDLWIVSANEGNFPVARLIYFHRQGYYDPVAGMRIIAITSIPTQNGMYMAINNDCVVRALNGGAFHGMLGRRLPKKTQKEMLFLNY